MPLNPDACGVFPVADGSMIMPSDTSRTDVPLVARDRSLMFTVRTVPDFERTFAL